MATRISLGELTLVGVVGRGSSGEVHLAVHRAQEVEVAVKVMTAARARVPKFREAFSAEVRAVAGLDHPGVVRVLDLGVVDDEAERDSEGALVAGSPYLTMELAAGSLRNRPRPVSYDSLRAHLVQLLAGLAHAHSQGVVHRDVKPGNVLVASDGRTMLSDFGLAHAVHQAHGVLSGGGGTPSFMAPEQFLGRWRDFGPWTDLYGLGTLAWALCAGRTPYRGRRVPELRTAHLSGQLPALQPRFAVPRGFEDWLRRLLQVSPRWRFQRAADAAVALSALGEVDPDLVRGADEPTDEVPFATSSSPTSDDLAMELDGSSLSGTGPLLPPRVAPPLGKMPQIRPPASNQLVGVGLGLYGLRRVPFVGRVAERRVLWGRLLGAKVSAGTRVASLRGAAGVGKTRLAMWLATEAHAAGAAEVLPVSHRPEAGVAHGLGHMVIAATSGLGLDRDALGKHLDRWLVSRGEQDPYLRHALIDAVWPTPPRPGHHPAFSSPAERYAVIRSFLQVLGGGFDDGAQRPVVLVVDDAQWGPDSLAFVRYLAAHGDGGLPLLVVLTVREEALEERPRERAQLEMLESLPVCEVLRLAVLGPQERHQLVEQLLGLDSQLCAQVEERTDGHPLFAVQLVGDWVHRGVLEAGRRGFVLRPGETAELPDDIHQLWAARIGRVLRDRAESTRGALELAAVLGDVVSSVEWRGACRIARLPVDDDLVEQLYLRRLAAPSGTGWAFTHGMLRESLLRSAAEGARMAEHHDAAATALQLRVDVARQPGMAERLGRHLIGAARWAEAAEPLSWGADERQAISDYVGAKELRSLVVESLDRAGADTFDPRRGHEAAQQAKLLLALGELAAADELAMEVAASVRPEWLLLRPAALRVGGLAAAKQGRLVEAEERLARAAEAALTLGDLREQARAEQSLGEVHRVQGHCHEAQWYGERALATFLAIEDRRGLADAHIGLAAAASLAGDGAQERSHVEQALVFYEQCGARFGLAAAENALGDVRRKLGDLDGAAEAYGRAHERLQELGSADRLVPLLNLGLTLIDGGQLVGSQAPLRRGAELARASGRMALVGVAHAALTAGDAALGAKEAFAAIFLSPKMP